jgi:hypothetical protein
MSQKGDFEAVRKDIVKLLHQPEYDDGSAGPVLVRLAWYVSLFSAQSLLPEGFMTAESLSFPALIRHFAILSADILIGTHQEPTMRRQIPVDPTGPACDMNLKVAILPMQVSSTRASSLSQ